MKKLCKKIDKFCKKLFGKLDLTWKNLIIFAVAIGVYTAIVALLPFTYETSFRDIAIMLEWWILFGIIIIANSKSNLDSGLKCFVFFLISQPLVYLVQVPFSDMGWGLFGYYRYWFMLTLLCFPMGYIGYYIKKKNYLSIIILLPMFIELSLSGLGYLNSAIESFPHHLLSSIACFTFMIIITLGIFDKSKMRITMFVLSLITIVTILVLNDGLTKENYDVTRSLTDYNITSDDTYVISSFTGSTDGKAEIRKVEDVYYVDLVGSKNNHYYFTISDENENEYSFEYYFNKDGNEVILRKEEK